MARSVGGVFILVRGREDFLIPTTLFESYGVDLLGSRGDWQPPVVGIFVPEL